MLIWRRSVFTLVKEIYAEMSALGTFQLTHPELLSETQLRDILKSSCIDFSNYEKLSKSELIEMYKRVAMPLPQRQRENTRSTNEQAHSEEKNSKNEAQADSDSPNDNAQSLKRNLNDSEKTLSSSDAKKSISPVNEQKQPPKKIRLTNSKGGTECNGIDKRSNDGTQDGSPLKKRQKITWP